MRTVPRPVGWGTHLIELKSLDYLELCLASINVRYKQLAPLIPVAAGAHPLGNRL